MGTDLLDGTAWVVERGVEVPRGVRLTVRFAGGAVAGSSGCNTFRGGYRAGASSLGLAGPLATTRKLGPPDAMAAEQAFLGALGRVRAWQSDGQRLDLLDHEGTVLLGLRRQHPGDLLGEWVVTAVHRPGRDAVVSTTGDVRIVFEPGHVHGTAGCNRFTGPWEPSDQRLGIGPLAVTARACPDEQLAEQERDVLHALATCDGFDLGPTAVHLLRPDGGIGLTLVPAAP